MKKLKSEFMKTTANTIIGASLLGMSLSPILANEPIKNGVVAAKATVFDALDKKNLALRFVNSEAVLSEDQKTDIEALIKSLEIEPTNLKLVLAGWADQQFLKGSKIKLTDADRSLADKRIQVVSEYIESIGTFKNTEKYNMAEDSTILSKVFGTDDSGLKKAMVGRKSDDSEINSLATILKDKGGLSTVVVMFYDERDL